MVVVVASCGVVTIIGKFDVGKSSVYPPVRPQKVKRLGSGTWPSISGVSPFHFTFLQAYCVRTTACATVLSSHFHKTSTRNAAVRGDK